MARQSARAACSPPAYLASRGQVPQGAEDRWRPQWSRLSPSSPARRCRCALESGGALYIPGIAWHEGHGNSAGGRAHPLARLGRPAATRRREQPDRQQPQQPRSGRGRGLLHPRASRAWRCGSAFGLRLPAVARPSARCCPSRAPPPSRATRRRSQGSDEVARPPHAGRMHRAHRGHTSHGAQADGDQHHAPPRVSERWLRLRAGAGEQHDLPLAQLDGAADGGRRRLSSARTASPLDTLLLPRRRDAPSGWREPDAPAGLLAVRCGAPPRASSPGARRPSRCAITDEQRARPQSSLPETLMALGAKKHLPIVETDLGNAG